MSDQSMSGVEKFKDGAIKQAAIVGTAAAIGAATGRALVPGAHNHFRGQFATQVGSAMGAAAAGGKGLKGSVGAGVAVVGAKVALVTAGAAVAAPFVLGAAAVGGIGFGLYKLFKDE